MENEAPESDVVHITHAIVSSVTKLINDKMIDANDGANVLCNAFWAYIALCSQVDTVDTNLDDAYSKMTNAYKTTKKMVAETSWDFFAQKNGVGNS